MTTVRELRAALDAFAAARDWQQFHSPKNLAAGLSIEAAEVLELFQWRTEAQSAALDERTLESLKQEIGDVQLYLINLAGKFDLDPLDCALAKLSENERKYPADRVRGSARKYDEYNAT